MAINWGELTPQIPGLAPIQLGVGSDGMSMERQRLQLMREEFENTKANQQRQQELGRLEEQGRTARSQLEQQRLAEAAALKQADEVKKQKLDLYGKFSELNGKGQVEEARAMAPLMNAAGMSVDLQGEVGGLPSYRIFMSPEEEAKARADEEKQGIGYGTDDSEAMTAPAGIGSTEDAFKQALGASQQAEQTGAPARAPDEPDYTGGVPKNVIDTGAIHAQTLARLNPALGGLVASYPQEYQESARQSAGAIAGMGLPLEASLKQFQEARQSPDSLIRANIQADATRGEQGVKRADQQATHSQEFFKNGESFARNAAQDAGLVEAVKRRDQIANARNILTNNDPSDDYSAGTIIARLNGDNRVSNQDITRVLGKDSLSFIDRLKAGAFTEAFGGLSPDQRRGLVGMLNKAQSTDDETVFGYLGSLDEQVRHPDTDPDVGKGMQSYARMTVPRSLRAEYEKRKKAAAEQGRPAPAPPGPFNMEEDSRAPQQRGVMEPNDATQIPQSSRISFEHNNPGNLKFVGQDGATQGEAAQDGGHWAKFQTVDAGLEALRQQILKDGEAGMSVRAFITKYAPPGSNDTKTYIEQAARELKANPDDALAETDPYDVLRFIAKKESGTELPSQYGGKSGGDDVAAKKARLQELLQKQME